MTVPALARLVFLWIFDVDVAAIWVAASSAFLGFAFVFGGVRSAHYNVSCGTVLKPWGWNRSCCGNISNRLCSCWSSTRTT